MPLQVASGWLSWRMNSENVVLILPLITCKPFAISQPPVSIAPVWMLTKNRWLLIAPYGYQLIITITVLPDHGCQYPCLTFVSDTWLIVYVSLSGKIGFRWSESILRALTEPIVSLDPRFGRMKTILQIVSQYLNCFAECLLKGKCLKISPKLIWSSRF